MSFYVGTDLLEIKRMKRCLENPHFLCRVFGEQERRELEARRTPPQSAAACFCAKEAFSKVLGRGVRGFSLTEVELLHRANGAPYLSLSGRAQQLAAGLSFSVSITHSDEYALAVVVAYNADGKEGSE